MGARAAYFASFFTPDIGTRFNMDKAILETLKIHRISDK